MRLHLISSRSVVACEIAATIVAIVLSRRLAGGGHGVRPRRLRGAVRAMAHTTAWAQLRSSGREGSATADDLIALSGSRAWRLALINYTRRYERVVDRDWRRFVVAHEDGLLAQPPANRR